MKFFFKKKKKKKKKKNIEGENPCQSARFACNRRSFRTTLTPCAAPAAFLPRRNCMATSARGPKAHGLKHRRDAVGNLVIYVPGTKGREKAPAVILQGHVDIVAEKDKSTDFDFLEDPIEVVVNGDWVIAPRPRSRRQRHRGGRRTGGRRRPGRCPRPARAVVHRGRGDHL